MYDDGVHAFRHMQPRDPDAPIGYDPCHRIPVSVNLADAPSDADAPVKESIRRINAVSGLRLQYVGATDQVATGVLDGPVLVTWTPPRAPPGPRGAPGATTASRPPG